MDSGTRYVSATLSRRVNIPSQWPVKRTNTGVRFFAAGVRIDVHHDAVADLADALVDALEQDPPPAPALQLAPEAA